MIITLNQYHIYFIEMEKSIFKEYIWDNNSLKILKI